jgi:ribose transport system substrate-binding protein
VSGLLAIGLFATACGATSTTSPSASTATSEAWFQSAVKTYDSETGLTTTWLGPTSGPAAVPNKYICYVGSQPINASAIEWAAGTQAAATAVGWKFIVIDDPDGSVEGAANAVEQCTADGVNGIVTNFPTQAIQPALTAARQAGIFIVGQHAAAEPGADASQQLFYNVSQDPYALGEAIVDWAVADSQGKARIVLLYDSLYQVAVIKDNGMLAAVKACKTCTLLENDNTPLANVTTTMPALATSLVSEYGTNDLYVLSIADTYDDYLVPALKAAGVPQSVKLGGMDGDVSAYERIEAGDEYQQATLPLPYTSDGYQAIDELNRAFAGDQPFNFNTPVHVVTKANVNEEGGSANEWVPSDGFAAHYDAIWGVS